ncbi:MAG: cyclic nucleotide-binding domain-containing protein, partial [Thermodesulfobacteriota bacterium]
EEERLSLERAVEDARAEAERIRLLHATDEAKAQEDRLSMERSLEEAKSEKERLRLEMEQDAQRINDERQKLERKVNEAKAEAERSELEKAIEDSKAEAEKIRLEKAAEEERVEAERAVLEKALEEKKAETEKTRHEKAAEEERAESDKRLIEGALAQSESDRKEKLEAKPSETEDDDIAAALGLDKVETEYFDEMEGTPVKKTKEPAPPKAPPQAPAEMKEAAPPKDAPRAPEKIKEAAGAAEVEDAELIGANISFPRTPLLSDFTEEELFEVINKVKFHNFSAGEHVFMEGDEGGSLFIVVNGEAEVISRAKDNILVNYARLEEGDFFGEFTFFSNAKRNSGVKAITDLELLELTKEDLNDIIAKQPRVSDVLFEFYKERVVDRLMALSMIFRHLNEEDRKEVLKRVSRKTFARGSVVFSEGDKGEDMYLIKEGRALVWTLDTNGAKQVLGEPEEGDSFGEISLATNLPRMVSVTALTELDLVVFSKPVIKDILAKYPDIKESLEGIIKKRVLDRRKAKQNLFSAFT